MSAKPDGPEGWQLLVKELQNPLVYYLVSVKVDHEEQGLAGDKGSDALLGNSLGQHGVAIIGDLAEEAGVAGG